MMKLISNWLHNVILVVIVVVTVLICQAVDVYCIQNNNEYYSKEEVTYYIAPNSTCNSANISTYCSKACPCTNISNIFSSLQSSNDNGASIILKFYSGDYLYDQLAANFDGFNNITLTLVLSLSLV